MRPVAFIDVEASGLGAGSYPIEIGWATLDGQSASVLIRRAAHWSADDWDALAEDLHRISRDTLLQHGQPAWDVAARLNALFGQGDWLVLSDAPEMDRHWLARLFGESPFAAAFTLNDYEQALRAELARRGRKLQAEVATPAVHRAEADAIALRQFWLEQLTTSL